MSITTGSLWVKFDLLQFIHIHKNLFHDYEHVEIIFVNCGLRNEYENDLRSNETPQLEQ